MVLFSGVLGPLLVMLFGVGLLADGGGGVIVLFTGGPVFMLHLNC